MRFLFSFLYSWGLPAFCSTETPTVISDGMVLQRQMKLPIWGWADAGSKVVVEFAGQSRGHSRCQRVFQSDVEPLKASAENRVLKVSAGSDSVSVKNVLVGEVWLCSGQSNMQWSLIASAKETRDPKDQPVADFVKNELKTHFDPLIRQIAVPTVTSYDKEQDFFNGSWVPADSPSQQE